MRDEKVGKYQKLFTTIQETVTCDKGQAEESCENIHQIQSKNLKIISELVISISWLPQNVTLAPVDDQVHRMY